MNKIKHKLLSKIVEWLEIANSNKFLNIGLLAIVIISILAFYVFTYPDSTKRLGMLLVPAISIVDIFFLNSKNHIVRETANFVAALLFIGFFLSAAALLVFGIVIYRSL
jgi:hypothetical protein